MLVEGQRVAPCDCALARVHQQHGKFRSEDVLGQHCIHGSGLRRKYVVVSVGMVTERKLSGTKDLYR